MTYDSGNGEDKTIIFEDFMKWVDELKKNLSKKIEDDGSEYFTDLGIDKTNKWKTKNTITRCLDKDLGYTGVHLSKLNDVHLSFMYFIVFKFYLERKVLTNAKF